MKNLWLTLSAIGIIVVLILLEIFAWKEVGSWSRFAHEFLNEPTTITTFWSHLWKVFIFVVLVYSASAVLVWDVGDKSFYEILFWWLLIPTACIVALSAFIATGSENSFIFIVGRNTNTALWIGNIILLFAFIYNRANLTDSTFSDQFEDFHTILAKRRREVAESKKRKEEKENAKYQVILRTPEEQESYNAKLAVEGKREIIYNTRRVILDISPEACGEWGVSEGMRIRTKIGRMNILGIGVRPFFPAEEGNYLWMVDRNEEIIPLSRETWEEIFLSPTFLIFKNPEEEKAYEAQLKAKGKREIFFGDNLVIVDTNDAICEKWGVKAGMNILTSDKTEAIVLGVGIYSNRPVMWILKRGEEGASFYPAWKDAETFKSEGFKILKSPEEQEAYESQLKAEGKREIFWNNKISVLLDTTEPVCEKWGVRAGMRITHKNSPRNYLVLGAGMLGDKMRMFFQDEKTKQLDYSIDWTNAETFESEGFQIIQSPEEEEAYEAQLAAEDKMQVILPDKSNLILDISDAACMRFGVRAGTIIRSNKGPWTCVGVGVAGSHYSTSRMLGLCEGEAEYQYINDWNSPSFIIPGRIVYIPPFKESYLRQMAAEGKIQVQTHEGSYFLVDTNDSICEKWGVKAGMNILIPSGKKALVLGVGVDPIWFDRPAQMWFILEDAHGVSYWIEWKNAETFKSEGFQILETIESKKNIYTIDNFKLLETEELQLGDGVVFPLIRNKRFESIWWNGQGFIVSHGHYILPPHTEGYALMACNSIPERGFRDFWHDSLSSLTNAVKEELIHALECRVKFPDKNPATASVETPVVTYDSLESLSDKTLQLNDRVKLQSAFLLKVAETRGGDFALFDEDGKSYIYDSPTLEELTSKVKAEFVLKAASTSSPEEVK